MEYFAVWREITSTQKEVDSVGSSINPVFKNSFFPLQLWKRFSPLMELQCSWSIFVKESGTVYVCLLLCEAGLLIHSRCDCRQPLSAVFARLFSTIRPDRCSSSLQPGFVSENLDLKCFWDCFFLFFCRHFNCSLILGASDFCRIKIIIFYILCFCYLGQNCLWSELKLGWITRRKSSWTSSQPGIHNEEEKGLFVETCWKETRVLTCLGDQHFPLLV